MITREHIIEFIKKQKVSFIASVDEEGIFSARDASNMRALC